MAIELLLEVFEHGRLPGARGSEEKGEFVSALEPHGHLIELFAVPHEYARGYLKSERIGIPVERFQLHFIIHSVAPNFFPSVQNPRKIEIGARVYKPFGYNFTPSCSYVNVRE